MKTLQAKLSFDLCARYCRAIVKHYRFNRCAVYHRHVNGTFELVISDARDPNDPLASQLAPPIHLEQCYEKRRSVERFSEWANEKEPGPREVKRERLLEAVYVPIKKDPNGRIGEIIIEFRWRGRRRTSTTGPLPHHDTVRLEQLAGHLERALEIPIRTERAREARASLQRRADYFVVHVHYEHLKPLLKIVASLNDLPTASGSKREELMKAIRKEVACLTNVFQRLQLPDLLLEKTPFERVPLNTTIRKVLKDVEKQGHTKSNGVKIVRRRLSPVKVWAVPKMLEEALYWVVRGVVFAGGGEQNERSPVSNGDCGQVIVSSSRETRHVVTSVLTYTKRRARELLPEHNAAMRLAESIIKSHGGSVEPLQTADRSLVNVTLPLQRVRTFLDDYGI